MTPVELHDAFMFTCDECGRDTFIRAITISQEQIDGTGDAEIIDEIATAFGEIIKNFEDEDLIQEGGVTYTARPKIVKCDHCNSEFQTFEEDDEYSTEQDRNA